MLVLTRRVGQSIVIGDNVVVTVLEVRGEQVRIGVEAPRTVEVMRSEIYRAIEEANQAAAQSTAGMPLGSPDHAAGAPLAGG